MPSAMKIKAKRKMSMASEPAVVSSSLSFDCRIEAGDWPALGDLEDTVQKTLDSLIANAHFKEKRSVLDGSEVSVLFTDDAHISAINGEFRQKPKPTNVLSFPQQPPGLKKYGPLLGDIVLAQETVFREAMLEKKEIIHHLQHLMVHGFLHLVGFDHENESDAHQMEALEVDILKDLRIENPYCETVK